MKRQILILISIKLLLLAGCIKNTKLNEQYVQKVRGKITSDTVWKGVIEVQEKIIVPDGISLTIKPGTVIRFKKTGNSRSNIGDNRIYIQKTGKLIANGQPDNNIIFTSAEKDPKKSNWQGIEFHSEVNGNKIKYCRIEYANEAIVCILSSPEINNNIITKNNKGICLWQNSNPDITNNLIVKNNIGILSSSGSKPVISYNKINNIENIGILCEKGAEPLITDNEIFDCFYGIKNVWGGSAKIKQNILMSNKYGIYYQLVETSGMVEGNTIEENEYGIYGEKKAYMSIVGNLINKNKYGIFSRERTKGEIKNNTIKKNEYGIYCSRSSHLDITKNNLLNNTIGILCEFSSYPKINNNNIYGQREYDIKLGLNQSAEWTKNIWDENEIKKWEKSGRFGLIDAAGNYWGKSTTKEMNEKGFESHIMMIYDYYKEQFINIEGENYERDKVDFRNWKENEIK